MNENCKLMQPSLHSFSLSNIAEFYRDRSIFITGATGFMGKVLVEKLLRSCPDIKTIYLLMRPKKGQDIHHRLTEEFHNHVVIAISIFQILIPAQNSHIHFQSDVWKT